MQCVIPGGRSGCDLTRVADFRASIVLPGGERGGLGAAGGVSVRPSCCCLGDKEIDHGNGIVEEDYVVPEQVAGHSAFFPIIRHSVLVLTQGSFLFIGKDHLIQAAVFITLLRVYLCPLVKHTY